MTEAEWLASTDPRQMLAFLKGKVSDRKLRLFACACTRRVWEPVWKTGRHESDRATVEAVEQLFDGTADSSKLATIRAAASLEVELLACENAFGAAWWATEELPDAMPDWREEMAPQAELLRDILGNLFHPVGIERSWLTAAVVGLAEAIYSDWAFERLRMLADALEEAGCNDEAILSHCRGSGPHVGGCWVTDLILGRQ